MRGRGQVPFRTADINWGWVERRQEEKLSWQPVFHRKLQGILFSWVVTIALKLSFTKRLPRQESEQVLLSYPERHSWMHTASQCIRDVANDSFCWCLNPGILATAKQVKDLQGWPCAHLAAARDAGRVTGGNDWGAALHLEGSGLSCPWEVGRKGWDVQQELCSQYILLPLLKQPSISLPCLEDVILSLHRTLLIYIFMA